MAVENFCPQCRSIEKGRIEWRTETLWVRKQRVVLTDVPVCVCTSCGHDRVDVSLQDQTLVRAYQAAGLLPCVHCGRYRAPREECGCRT